MLTSVQRAQPDALDHARLWPVLDALQDRVATKRGYAPPAGRREAER